MKRIGIVCDNYKINAYKKQLSRDNILIDEIEPYGNEKCSIIKILCKDEEFEKMKDKIQTITNLIDICVRKSSMN